MINLAEVEYLNSCFITKPPEVPTSSLCESSEEIVNDFAVTLGKAFKGFVLTVVDNNGDQYTANNVGTVSALKMISSAVDMLQEEA
jgi:hypothetical protein